ncbi:MAG: flagellar hook-associated protein FlgK [Myxococcota bacterium]
MSLFDTLGAGLSGLSVASAGLQTTTHNVTNASTHGFTRRAVQIGTRDPVFRRGVWLGQGAQVGQITRASDAFALGRLLTTTGHASSAAAEHSALVAFEGLFEPSSGVSLRQSVDEIFDALQGATADPSDQGFRLDVLSSLETFTSTVNRIGSTLEQGISERSTTVEGSIVEVNAMLAEVASLNFQVQSAGGALAAGDLADRRDELIGALADTVGATVFYERDGTATVRLGGHAAVSGGSARTVGLSADGGTLTLSVDDGVVDLNGEIGGRLGGELVGRSRLESWLSDLDQLVTDLAGALNAQNTAGFTPTGAAGGALFTLPAAGSVSAGLKLDPGVQDNPFALAFAANATGEAGDGGNLTAFIALESAPLVGGAQTVGAFATRLTGRVGSETALAASAAESTESSRLDAEELFSSLTGVNLDEEAVRLVQYQAAYQAAAKVIQVTDETLDALMRIAS